MLIDMGLRSIQPWPIRRTTLLAACFLLLLLSPGPCAAAMPTQEMALSTSDSFHNPVYCGTWQNDYIKLHSDILEGRAPPRYAVSVAIESGTADRVVGVITGFYFALLSGRAFQIANPATDMPAFELAWDAPNINWTRTMDEPGLLDPLLVSYQGPRELGPDVNRSKYAMIYMVNDDQKSDEIMAQSNLSKMPKENPDVETVFVSSNRGRSFKMFRNPYHMQQLDRIGLRPDTAFSCAYNFLFRAKPAVYEMYKHELGVLRQHKDALKIGLALRAGDGVFRGTEADLDFGAAYWDCAHEVERTRRVPGQPVLWYIIADSLEIRKQAKARFGSKVLTSEVKHIQSDCHNFANCGDEEQRAISLQSAAGQLMTFALTDVQLVSTASGFGRVGAWLSGKFHNIYEIQSGFGEPGMPRKCGVEDYSSLEESSTMWSHI